MHEQEKGFGQTEGTATAVLQGSETLSAKDSQDYSELARLLGNTETSKGYLGPQMAQVIGSCIDSQITGQEIAPEVKNGFSDFENQLAEEIKQLIQKAYKAHKDQLATSWKSESFEERVDSLAESFVKLVVDRGETDSKKVAHRGATAIVKGMRAAATDEPVVRNGEAEDDFKLACAIRDITRMALICS